MLIRLKLQGSYVGLQNRILVFEGAEADNSEKGRQDCITYLNSSIGI